MITPLHVPFLTSLLGSVYNIYAYKMVLIQVNVANTDGKYVHPQRQELKMFSIIMQSWLICTCKSQCTDCNFCTITVRRFLSNKYAKYARTNVYKIREFFSTCMCKNREHNSLV